LGEPGELEILPKDGWRTCSLEWWIYAENAVGLVTYRSGFGGFDEVLEVTCERVLKKLQT